MQTATLCNDEDDSAIGLTLQPIMTYTHRVVGYEATCSAAWEDHRVRGLWKEEAESGSMFHSYFAARASEVPMHFAISCSTAAAECAALFPKGSLIFLELSPEVDRAHLSAQCSALLSAGFSLGISEYQGESMWEGVLPLVSHIRCSYTRNLLPRQREMLGSALRRRVSFVARGIETKADLADAMQSGFQLFQGRFAAVISRLHWPEQEFIKRALLLEKVCHDSEATSVRLAEFLEWTSLSDRFSSLLGDVMPNLRATTSHAEHLFAELGAERVRHFMKICLMRDLTGSTSSVFLYRLFHSARFHELMRSAALRSPVPSACFEGMMLSALYALDDSAADGRSAMEYAFAFLKHGLGTPMNCSAFDRNHRIANMYSEARWDEVEQLCRADGYALGVVSRLFHEAAAGAYNAVTLDKL